MSSKKRIVRTAWTIVAVLLIVVAILGILIYRQIYTTNLVGTGKSNEFLYIPTDSRIEDVIEILENSHLLLNEKSFRWTAHQMKYDLNVRPGKYKLKPRMSNKELVTLLRSGKQVPVNVTFNNIRTKEQLAERISKQIEAKPGTILNLLNDPDYTVKMNFTTDNILSMFIPDTYEFFWNTSADKFLQKMKKEYDRFWSSKRLAQAAKIKLTPVEISIIASIVQLESNKEDEKPLIAGVYVNRYKKDWKLEADPTLVYALGDFTINRVLSVYKQINSPYNTYKFKGLPPGPICLPTVSSLSAVLNYTQHRYMYFCAKEDFSGYHSFATNYGQHLHNARKFQRALDKRGIRM